MLSLRICRYSLDNLMIEILKLVEKCKVYQNKESQGSPGAFDEKVFVGGRDLTTLKIRPPGLPGGMVTLGIE